MIEMYKAKCKKKPLKCAGQTCDAIPQEYPQLQILQSHELYRREGGTVQDVFVHTSNNKKRNIL